MRLARIEVCELSEGCARSAKLVCHQDMPGSAPEPHSIISDVVAQVANFHQELDHQGTWNCQVQVLEHSKQQTLRYSRHPELQQSIEDEANI